MAVNPHLYCLVHRKLNQPVTPLSQNAITDFAPDSAEVNYDRERDRKNKNKNLTAITFFILFCVSVKIFSKVNKQWENYSSKAINFQPIKINNGGKNISHELTTIFNPKIIYGQTNKPMDVTI